MKFVPANAPPVFKLTFSEIPIRYLVQTQRINCIKAVRWAADLSGSCGLGLREAKEFVDGLGHLEFESQDELGKFLTLLNLSMVFAPTNF